MKFNLFKCHSYAHPYFTQKYCIKKLNQQLHHVHSEDILTPSKKIRSGRINFDLNTSFVKCFTLYITPEALMMIISNTA